MSKETVRKHESFGLLSISRIQSNKPISLFGSFIEHQNTIKLRIKKAEEHRDLNQNWYFGTNTLLEIELSPVQWAEAIMNMNVGDGIPCTIKYINGKEIEDPPIKNLAREFNDEFQKDMENIGNKINETIDLVSQLMEKPSITKSERKTILNSLKMLKQHLVSNIPFVHQQFNEAMGKTVQLAKSEIESHWTNTMLKLGNKVIVETSDKTVLLPQGGKEKNDCVYQLV